MLTSFVLGIDGGGTKTVALLADPQGTCYGRGQAGSSNYHTQGEKAATAALDIAIQNAFQDAGLRPQPIAAIALGLAGVDRPEDIVIFNRWAEHALPGARISVTNDSELTLAAGTPAGWGIAAICGTGSIVVGRAQTGSRIRADGWGYLLGDDGSGFAVGLAALRAVAAAHDGRGPETILHSLVMPYCHVHEPVALIRWIYRDRIPTSEVAGLAALVFEAADLGDGMAAAIVQQAAAGLAASIVAVARRLGSQQAWPCALGGGLIANSPLYQAEVRAEVAARDVELKPVTVVADPVQGAVILARRLLGEE